MFLFFTCTFLMWWIKEGTSQCFWDTMLANSSDFTWSQFERRGLLNVSIWDDVPLTEINERHLQRGVSHVVGSLSSSVVNCGPTLTYHWSMVVYWHSFFFVYILCFFVVFFYCCTCLKKIVTGVGGHGLANPSFSRIFQYINVLLHWDKSSSWLSVDVG